MYTGKGVNDIGDDEVLYWLLERSLIRINAIQVDR